MAWPSANRKRGRNPRRQRRDGNLIRYGPWSKVQFTVQRLRGAFQEAATDDRHSFASMPAQRRNGDDRAASQAESTAACVATHVDLMQWPSDAIDARSFAQEDHCLYPPPDRLDRSRVAETANAFRREMGELWDQYEAFARSWSTRPRSFSCSRVQGRMHTIFGAIEDRCSRENELLFPLAESGSSRSMPAEGVPSSS